MVRGERRTAHEWLGILTKLSNAAQALDRAELTKAGRALQKHGNRPGSKFPKAKGCPTDINNQAQKIVDDILHNPNSTMTQRHHARFGDIIEINSPTGEGIRYDVNGNFIGFIE